MIFLIEKGPEMCFGTFVAHVWVFVFCPESRLSSHGQTSTNSFKLAKVKSKPKAKQK